MLLSSRRVAVAGAVVVVECDDRVLAAEVAEVVADLPDAAPGSSIEEHRVLVVAASGGFDVTVQRPGRAVEDLGHCDSRPVALGLVVWAVGRISHGASDDLVVLHGAVVAGPTGAVVACGASGTGKTTLAAAAAAAGFTYLSDDVAVIDHRTLTVAPHARALLVRPGTRHLLADRLAARGIDAAPTCGAGEWVVPASRLGAPIASTPVRLVGVLDLERGPEPSIHPLRRAELLHRMVVHCTTIRGSDASQFAALAEVAASVPGHRLVVDPQVGALDLVGVLVGAA